MMSTSSGAQARSSSNKPMAYATPTPVMAQRTVSTSSAAQVRTSSNQAKTYPPVAMQSNRATAAPGPQFQATPAPVMVQPQPTPTPVPPPDIQTYLDRQLSGGKFHLTVNGKEMTLTPFHTWRQKSTGVNTTSTCVDMRNDEGRVYDIDFLTTGQKVTGVKIHRINGEIVH
jgi:hypothetical protein